MASKTYKQTSLDDLKIIKNDAEVLSANDGDNVKDDSVCELRMDADNFGRLVAVLKTKIGEKAKKNKEINDTEKNLVIAELKTQYNTESQESKKMLTELKRTVDTFVSKLETMSGLSEIIDVSILEHDSYRKKASQTGTKAYQSIRGYTMKLELRKIKDLINEILDLKDFNALDKAMSKAPGDVITRIGGKDENNQIDLRTINHKDAITGSLYAKRGLFSTLIDSKDAATILNVNIKEKEYNVRYKDSKDYKIVKIKQKNLCYENPSAQVPIADAITGADATTDAVTATATDATTATATDAVTAPVVQQIGGNKRHRQTARTPSNTKIA